MLTLKKYISNNTKIVPENILENHFKLEFDIRNNIVNSININEKYGNYDGQIPLVNEIAKSLFSDIKDNDGKNIKYNIEKQDLEDCGFTNIFFKTIEIEYKNSIHSGYDSNVTYDDKSKLIDKIHITINSLENKNYDDIYTTLVHELTHAFEDYQRILGGKTPLYKEYHKSNYKTMLDKMKLNGDTETICNSILYYLKRFEKNAYISELTSELEKRNTKVNSYKDALDIFYNSKCYIAYLTLQEVFKDNYNSEEFKDCYNKLNNCKLSINKIYKKVINQFRKIFNKISSLVPKIYYDYYVKQNISENLIRNHKSNIEILQLINNGYISKFLCVKMIN